MRENTFYAIGHALNKSRNMEAGKSIHLMVRTALKHKAI